VNPIQTTAMLASCNSRGSQPVARKSSHQTSVADVTAMPAAAA